MATVLVIGASGFVGRRLAVALLAAGYTVRCLARDPAGIADLGRANCGIVQGDMLDADSTRHPADRAHWGLPRGGIRGLLDSLEGDGVGDPTPIRALLPRNPLSFREAVQRAAAG